MDIAPGIEIVGLGLKIGKTLIIGDLHLGIEEAMNKEGILVPRFQFKDLVKRLEEMLRNAKPEIVVINGDLKHEFGTISKQEWNDVLNILDLISAYAKKIVLVKGNHDAILGPIARKQRVEITDSYREGNILVIHGHKKVALPKGIEIIIIGHDHPAINLREGSRAETYKCFLKGKFNKKTLIVMPSLSAVTEGTDVLRYDLLSPYLHQDLKDFEVFIIADKAYSFGKIKSIDKKI
ncbi:MAG TPA: metallophosphoesterase [Candidatus Nanoarchaeia archaeon]|nr:metallophosphoesterase [Candidatus Nanoarchaeia archaeon]